MSRRVLLAATIALAVGAAIGGQAASNGLAEANELLFRQLLEVHRLGDGQLAALRAIFARSGFIGQGNPAISSHPVSEQRCRDELAKKQISYADPTFERICAAPYMAPLYDPAHQKPEDAPAYIDQFELPEIPCVYPVVWVKAHEAAEMCEAVGKRLCDAHEWEGACASALEAPDYRFDLAQGVSPNAAVERMRHAHNRADAPTKSWSYGPAYRSGVCGTSSHKSPNCPGGGWGLCGSNTFPDGTFPTCRSPLGVYDLNGNAAEHMNLPLDPSRWRAAAARASATPR